MHLQGTLDNGANHSNCNCLLTMQLLCRKGVCLNTSIQLAKIVVKSMKLIVVCLGVRCCILHSDDTAARGSFHVSKGGSIWIPMRIKGTRHKRFLSKPTHLSFLSFEDFTRGGLVFAPLLLLSGNVETNPGPTGNQVRCIRSIHKESRHMLQCRHCLQWCHSRRINISPSLANTYPFICPFCVKDAVTTISNVNLEISSFQSCLNKPEEASKHMPTQIKSLDGSLGAMSEKVKALPILHSTNKSSVNSPMHSVHTSFSPPPKTTSSSFTTDSSPNSSRKFDLVIFGVKESPKGTPRQSRMTNDHESVTAILNFLDSRLSSHSIHDCVRLGKYSDSRNRPLWV